MANVLGSLVVDVLANTGTFVSGMEKASLAARRSGNQISTSFGKLGSVFAPLGAVGQQIAGVLENIGQVAGKAMTKFHALGTTIAGFEAAAAGVSVGALAIGGALFAAANRAAAFGNKIFEAREKTGIAAIQLSGIAALAKETGGDFESLTNSLARATVNLTKTAEGGGKLNPQLFALMGGAKGAAELGLEPMGDRLQTVLARIFSLKDAGDRAVALNELLGKGWTQNVTVLKMLAQEGYAPAIAQAHRMGLALDDLGADKAHQYVLQMGQLKAQIEGIGLSIGSKLVPQIADSIAALHVWGQVWGDVGRELVDVGKVVADVATHDIAGASLAVADFSKQKADIQAALAGATKEATDTARSLAAAEGDEGKQTDKLAGSDARAAKATRDHAGAVLTLAEALNRLRTNDYDEMIRGKAENVYTAMQRGLSQVGSAFQPLMPRGIMPWPTAQMGGAFQPMGATGVGALTQMGAAFQPLDTVAPRLTTLQADFQSFFQKVADNGKDFGGKLAASFAQFTDGVSGQLAKLVVTGRANFRQLFQGLEEEILKSGIDKAFASIASSLFPSSGGGSTSATPTGISGFFSKIFGGFLAGGGDVTPGRAYVVGEKHPEFFVPKQSGEIRTALNVGDAERPMVNHFHFHGVQDFDSFRRSQTQMMTAFQNQLAQAWGRTGR